MKNKYIPTLDGWRALAISLVLLCHISPSITHAENGRLATFVGILGVRIFFGLSGFLITSLLLEEEKTSGEVDLWSFYRRRFLRIMPAASFFLAVVGLLSVAGEFNVTTRRWVDVLFFFANYSSAPYVYTLGHFWSLAVEEHFYFIWPTLFIVLATFQKRVSAAVVICLLIAAWRAIAWKYQITTENNPKFWGRTDINADAILWGAAIAVLATKSEVSSFLLSTSIRRITPLVYATVLAGIFLVKSWKLNFVLNDMSVVMGPILILQTSQLDKRSLILRIFEHPSVRWLGRISYSLYLWQQLFLTPGQNFPFEVFPLNLVFALCCAATSYYLIERPLIRRVFPPRSRHVVA